MANYFSLKILLLVVFASFGAAVVDKWVPPNFNWDAVDPGPRESWKGLYHNLSHPDVAVSKEVMAMGGQSNA